jgi:hypothetical protein
MNTLFKPRPKNFNADLIIKKLGKILVSVRTEYKPEIFTKENIYQMLVDSGCFINKGVDKNISNWVFDNSPVYSGHQSLCGSVYELAYNTRQKDIITETELLKINLKVNLLNGALFAISLVKSGFFIKKSDKGIIIYLNETKGGKPCWLLLWHGRIDIFELSNELACPAGFGILSKKLLI